MHAKVQPPCKIEAQWPGEWPDLHFTEENCLVDESGGDWLKECCAGRPANPDTVENPYSG